MADIKNLRGFTQLEIMKNFEDPVKLRRLKMFLTANASIIKEEVRESLIWMSWEEYSEDEDADVDPLEPVESTTIQTISSHTTYRCKLCNFEAREPTELFQHILEAHAIYSEEI